jgi:YebC/PmpR family DNA-binding regulatory protein
MGRIFEKRKERMFARWSKNAKAFTKIGKEIAVAVKLGGGDPAGNPRLRAAVQTARTLNMPKDRVDAAIKRATSKDAEAFDEVFYEAYGPGGVALFIETATNNTTRTVANVRSVLTRYGGRLATAGALDFVFGHQGVFKIAKPSGDFDEFELGLIDHGLEEMFETDEGDLLLYTSFSQFGEMQRFLESQQTNVKSAGAQRVPASYSEPPAEVMEDLRKLIDGLEEDDDVQHVYHNMKPSDE